MQAFLEAVGISKNNSSTKLHPCSPRRPQLTRSINGDTSGQLLGGGCMQPSVVDISTISTAAEQGAVVLEEEAQSLQAAHLPEALALLTRWSQGLRKKPRADEAPPSFRAIFLRSRALEIVLESLRHNMPVRRALVGALHAAEGVEPEAVALELRGVLQLCLPRSAGPLVVPILRASLGSNPRCACAALGFVQRLKDDWSEVVHSQAMRGLERQLDSLAYDLQKTALARSRASSNPAPTLKGKAAVDFQHARKKACDQVTVLSRLCESISTAHERSEGRFVEVRAALRQLDADLLDVTGGVGEDDGFVEGRSTGDLEASTLDDATALLDEHQELVLERDELLGRLDQIDVRLRSINKRLGKAADAAISAWEEEAAPQVPSWTMSTTTAASSSDAAALHDIPIGSEKDHTLREVTSLTDVDEASVLPMQSGFMPAVTSQSRVAPVMMEASPPSPAAAEELAVAGTAMTAALEGEAHKATERLVSQLQQRRVQLLAGLASHLDGERRRLAGLLTAEAGPGGDVVVSGAQGALETSWQDARELSSRVRGSVGSMGPSGLLLGVLASGMRCRGRWVDGNYYDAEVQCVMGDGTIAVNWLRPRPEGESPNKMQLVTVSEFGGDDASHRILPWEDVLLAGSGPAGVTDVQAARHFFEARSSQDLLCFDCVAPAADWASVSFGIYLCTACITEHKKFGERASLVRRLADGWGWGSRELDCMRQGGNAAFQACLVEQTWPVSWPPKAIPAARRGEARTELYCSRLGEYYRRRLDALCTGGPAPQPPAPGQLRAPAAGDFMSLAEAAAVAQNAARRFEVIVVAARGRLQRLPPGSSLLLRTSSIESASGGGVFFASGGASEAFASGCGAVQLQTSRASSIDEEANPRLFGLRPMHSADRPSGRSGAPVSSVFSTPGTAGSFLPSAALWSSGPQQPNSGMVIAPQAHSQEAMPSAPLSVAEGRSQGAAPTSQAGSPDVVQVVAP